VTEKKEAPMSEKKKCNICKIDKEITVFPFKRNQNVRGKSCERCLGLIKNCAKKLRERTQEEVLKICKEMHPNGKKTCSVCIKEQLLSQFHSNNNSKDGLQAGCITCRRLKTEKDKAKESGCVNCGLKDITVMQFAHHSRDDKKVSLQTGRKVDPTRITSKKVFLEELPKMKVLCSNCHRLETAKENENSRSKSTKKMREYNRKKPRYEFVNAEKKRRESCIDCKVIVMDQNCQMFDYDHINPMEKIACISEMANNRKSSFEDIKKEMDKCELRCSNCHTKRTTRQQASGEFNKRKKSSATTEC
jgi:hypothetical protein